jgi:hypothetical protein
LVGASGEAVRCSDLSSLASTGAWLSASGSAWAVLPGIHGTTLHGQGNHFDGAPMATGDGTGTVSQDASIGSHLCSFNSRSTATRRRGILTA